MLARLFWDSERRRIPALWRLLLHTVLCVLFAAGGVFGVSALTGADPVDAPTPTLAAFAITAMVAIGGATALAGRAFDRRRFADFGMGFDRAWWRDLAFGLALGAGLMALIFAIEWAAGWIEIRGTMVSEDGNPAWLGLLSMGGVFLAVGVYEELLSRGYHLTNLREGFDGLFGLPRSAATVIAILLSSSIFGLLHAGNPNATTISTVAIVLAGVFLALPYVLTGRLAASIGLHITWNYFQGCVFGFPVSGNHIPARALDVEQIGPVAMTGGAFGPESGWMGIGAIALGCAITWGYARRTASRAE